MVVVNGVVVVGAVVVVVVVVTILIEVFIMDGFGMIIVVFECIVERFLRVTVDDEGEMLDCVGVGEVTIVVRIVVVGDAAITVVAVVSIFDVV